MQKQCIRCLNLVSDNHLDLCNVCISVADRIRISQSLPSANDNLPRMLHDNYKDDSLVIGLSGGVDSSYILAMCGEAGLKPKIFHFDNGWNTATANENIFKIVNKYKFELRTEVMHWPTFRSLQRSFLFAGVPDVELVTDHAIFALMVRNMKSNNGSVTLSGSNFQTEHGINKKYFWNKLDFKNISAVNDRYECIKLDMYPRVSLNEWIRARLSRSGSRVDIPLNQVNYSRTAALNFLKNAVDFRDYEFKHEESLFTKIYQRTLLPKKFNYRKDIEHINALIRNGEITKTDGLEKTKRFLNDAIMDDYEFEYFLRKLRFSDKEWESIANSKPKTHHDFPNLNYIYSPIRRLSLALGLSGAD
tara:strand:- start:2996 stop:4078 length:1083 start_codon:yes stop_codon:yes gene_type:complete